MDTKKDTRQYKIAFTHLMLNSNEMDGRFQELVDHLKIKAFCHKVI